MNIDEKELDEMLAVQINHLNTKGKVFLSDLIFEITLRNFRGFKKQDDEVTQFN